MIRVAINGYGRIGRVAHRIILEKHSSEIEVVAINAGKSTDLTGWLYLLKYDTNYGELKGHTFSIKTPDEKPLEVTTEAEFLGWLVVDNSEIAIFADRKPENLPWGALQIDTVIESTGAFVKHEDLMLHIKAGAKSVILSAPYKGDTPVPTYVLGVNSNPNGQDFSDIVINNASCTTNSISPVAKILEDNFGIEKAMMTTIHGYTSDQRLQDGGHKDYRRARAAAQNIVPTSTGATKAAAEAIPSLKGIFNGLAIRVPVSVGSLSDFTFLLKKDTTVEELNFLFKNAEQTEEFRGIIQTTTDPIVSSDIVGNPHSSIIDLSLTQVVGGNMVKIIAWYDNEYGYANRLVEQTLLLGKSAQIA
jgi:glyceraldehyde 3-phosphate dehydrogenase